MCRFTCRLAQGKTSQFTMAAASWGSGCRAEAQPEVHGSRGRHLTCSKPAAAGKKAEVSWCRRYSFLIKASSLDGCRCKHCQDCSGLAWTSSTARELLREGSKLQLFFFSLHLFLKNHLILLLWQQPHPKFLLALS